jgi:hypothetical protein
VPLPVATCTVIGVALGRSRLISTRANASPSSITWLCSEMTALPVLASLSKIVP